MASPNAHHHPPRPTPDSDTRATPAAPSPAPSPAIPLKIPAQPEPAVLLSGATAIASTPPTLSEIQPTPVQLVPPAPAKPAVPPPEVPPKPAPRAPAEPGSFPGLSLLLSGGGNIGIPGPVSSLGAGGSATLDLRIARWHVLARASLLSPLNGVLPPGNITIDRTALSALGAAELVRRGRFVLDAVVGIRVEAWTAASHGFSVTRAQMVWIPGGTLGARARLDIVWRLFAFVEIQGSLLASRPFGITGIDGAITPSALWGSAEGGAGLSIL